MEKDKYSVSLVYIKNIPNGTESALRVLITDAINEKEALGNAIFAFEKEVEGFNLNLKVIIKITK